MRSKKPFGAKRRCQVELLESRELLSTLLEGLAANDLAGSALAPVGNIFDDPATGLVGDDFAIAAPGAQGNQGEVYIVFGQPGLEPQPVVQQGCISPPARVQSCSLIQTLLSNQQALRIVGEGTGDLAGYSIAGVGDVIGDSRPDVLIGAPQWRNPLSNDRPGRAYLLGGDAIASTIAQARAVGGTSVATINLNCAAVTPLVPTIRCFNGNGVADEAGNSVAGIGGGFFMLSAPGSDAGGKIDRGEVYIFGGLRGATGAGLLTPFSVIRGPSVGGHLGGPLSSELLGTTPYRGSAISGIKSPALVPVAADVLTNPIYDVFDTNAPDLLVGAPDACQSDTCMATSIDRNGRVYLLSGNQLFNVGGFFDLSNDTQLKDLSAIVVQGAAVGDRLGTTISSAGDLDGDVVDSNGDGITESGFSDFMFSAPNRDIPGPSAGTSLLDAGEVYVVFGREVLTTPFSDGQCQSNTGRTTGPQQNFRQCRDTTGRVVPLNAGSFVIAGNQVGLTLRGDSANERAGMALADGGNYIDPTGRNAVVGSDSVGVGEIIIGAPLRDSLDQAGFVIPATGRAYVFAGSTDYASVSGIPRGLGLLSDPLLGQILDGRTARDNYGIAVAGVGDVHNPLGSPGDDIAIGANRVEVNLQNGVGQDVGEIELLFGNSSGLVTVPVTVATLLPFVQPGPFGPQALLGGFWSFTNRQPPGANPVLYPLVPSHPGPQDASEPEFLFPPYTAALRPNGSFGPFVPPGLVSTLFLPDRPIALVDRTGNVNVYGSSIAAGRGVNLTASLQSPRVQQGAQLTTADDGTISIFALDRTGHLVHHRGDGENWYAADVTTAAAGPTLAGSISVRQIETGLFLVSGQTATGDLVIYAGNEFVGWGTVNLTQWSGSSGSRPLAAAVSTNYGVDRSGHLVEYRPHRRGFKAFDVTAAAHGPLVEGDVAASLSIVNGRATFEVFARGTDDHLIRYFRIGKRWQAEDVSVRLTDPLGSAIDGAIAVASAGIAGRTVYAQSGGQIIEITSDWFGWNAAALPLPAGSSSVIGPLAAIGGATPTVYAFQPGGTIIEYTRHDSWQIRSWSGNDGSTSNPFLDLLTEMGMHSL